MKASALIAIAESDDMQDPKAKDTLKAAFAAAGLPNEVEVYTGTKHGWCPPDTAVYDHDAAEKAWGTAGRHIRESIGVMIRAYAAQSATTPMAPWSLERRAPGLSDVALDVLYCGVCHSDMHPRCAVNGRVFPFPAYRVTRSSAA